MKPNDDNAKLPKEQRPFRILIISGSNRRQYNCPGVDGNPPYSATTLTSKANGWPPPAVSDLHPTRKMSAKLNWALQSGLYEYKDL